ncbi:DNA-binding protein RDGA [Vibrio sp. MACH09]|uniref:XRE family transcriptional regulator n=1 Tax=Vibrio sp. MACH09 TaxID=3025122 RepID=UPI002792E0AE|nr:helix-turn-helix transcriptional regulator [Vibrio sp. MACH09]GLO64200.1 DNA-binding protein RDGA [Vibrio sp. MACH09]
MPTYTVGQKIQVLRKQRSLSQADLAREIGVAPVTVSKWEIDTSKPKGKSLLMLSELFNVSIDVLIHDAMPIQQTREQATVPFYSRVEQFAEGRRVREGELYESFSIDKSYITNPDATIAVRIHGDSMNPVFHDGTIVFINTDVKIVSDGRVYLVDHDELFRIKVLESIPNGLRLKSYNPNYPPEEIFYSKNSIKVVGQVVAQIQKY